MILISIIITFFKLQIKKLIKKEINEEKANLRKQNPSEPQHIEYALGKNCMFPKIYRKTIVKWKNLK